MSILPRHLDWRRRHNTVRAAWGSDTSGVKTYSFNSLGFRGEDYRPCAVRRVFVCGCSHTFGTGLNEEEAWPSVFKRRYAIALGIPEKDVNLLNFADAGASNDYICRTTIVQIAASRPDALAVLFTYKNRSEHWEGEQTRALGPWVLDATADCNPWVGDRERYRELAAAYYDLYSDELGTVQTLKNILLVQEFCRVRKIPFVLASLESRGLYTDTRHESGPQPLLGLLERSRFAELNIHDRDMQIDRAADGLHLGPQSHALIGKRLFEVFGRNHGLPT